MMPKNQVLLLRVPDWCQTPSCVINGKRVKAVPENGFYRLERVWKVNDIVELTFPMQPRLKVGTEQFADFNGTQPYWGIMEPPQDTLEYSGFVDGGAYAVVNYGPMAFGLCLQTRDASYYELNEERWHEFRYALNANSLKQCKVKLQDLPQYFRWSKDNAAISITVNADLIRWEPDKGDPKLPVEQPDVIQHDVELQLIPIGCAPYRLSMFPFL